MACLEIGASVTLAQSPFSGEFLLTHLDNALLKVNTWETEGDRRTIFVDIGGMKRVQVHCPLSQMGCYIDNEGRSGINNPPGYDFRQSVDRLYKPSHDDRLSALPEPPSPVCLALVEEWDEATLCATVRLENQSRVSIQVPLSYLEGNGWVWGNNHYSKTVIKTRAKPRAKATPANRTTADFCQQ